MKLQTLLILLVCTGCVVFSGSTFSQDGKRRPRAEIAEDADSTDLKPTAIRLEKSGTLERRVQDLEKQVLSLSRELKALRKEVKPAANEAVRPQPL